MRVDLELRYNFLTVDVPDSYFRVNASYDQVLVINDLNLVCNCHFVHKHLLDLEL
jgi:hypothetical protein